MVRRMAVALIVLTLTMYLGIPASAAQAGTIRVQLDYGAISSAGKVELYPVAEPVEGGYRLKDSFGGGVIRKEEACSPELAQWLAERTLNGGINQHLDAQGGAEFSGLETGLYLLIQTEAPKGWRCAAPFLVPLPMDGEWEVLACPKQGILMTQSPKTGQHPAPVFGAMGLVLSGTGLYLCIDKLRKK